MTYTRYSDDIYLSGNNVPVDTIKAAVRKIVACHGFRINHKKTKVLGRHQAQKVTAITVNDKMQVTRAYRRQLRQELYYLERFGRDSEAAKQEQDFINYLYKLQGRVAFVLYVDPENVEFQKAKERLEDMICTAWRHYSPPWSF